MDTINTNQIKKEESNPLPVDVQALKKAILDKVKEAGGTKAFYAQGDVVKQLTKTTMEALLQAELEEHLGFEKNSPLPKDTTNRRNGTDRKTIRGDFGEVEIDTPRDREGSFSPTIVRKGQSSVGKFSEKIISLYARGMSTREIEEHVREMYDIDISPQFVSRAVEKLHEELTEWQNRPLEPLYPVVYVDGLWVSARSGDNKGPVTKKCVYVVLGVSPSGHQSVLSLCIQETEGARFWLKVFNDLKARGVKDIFLLCGDGLKGLPEAARSVFPDVDIQLCVVHHVRSVTRFVPWQDRKKMCADMKPIYCAPTEEAARLAFQKFQEQWGKKYPASIDSWERHWDSLTTFLKYPPEIRKTIYTTNSIESLNALLRKNIASRKVFPTENSILALLYLNVKNFSLRWTKRQGWDMVMNQFSLMYPERIAAAFDGNLS